MKTAAFALVVLAVIAAVCFAACDDKSARAPGKDTHSSPAGTVGSSAAPGAADPAGEGGAAAKSGVRPPREETKTTASGLKYKVLKRGTGTVSPKATDTVEVHYHGTMPDGTVFVSSEERHQPASFPLNQVIPGWTEGVQLMKEGDRFRFEIPPVLAYGERGAGDKIPPNSTLIFEVELIKIH